MPGVASMPSSACGETTIRLAMAIASSTLFWMPRAMRSGATATSACRMYGRTSGTVPVTVTPGRLPSAVTGGTGARADDIKMQRREARAQLREDVAGEPLHGVDVRPVIHGAGEDDGTARLVL